MRLHAAVVVSPLLLCLSCSQLIIDDADRQVYRAIHAKQAAALGSTTEVGIGDEDGSIARPERMYDFAPRPLGNELPAAFRLNASSNQGQNTSRAPQEDPKANVNSATPADGAARAAATPGDNFRMNDSEMPPASKTTAADTPMLTEDVFTPDERQALLMFDLGQAIEFALRHGRELQDAKEALYLAALDLTLERHLWTPQFTMSARAEFADFGQIRSFDRAMSTLAEVAVSQRLPLGGEVTARIINSFMRDLGRHITSGETGTAILEANIPLLRGAGRVALESRYQAERDLIYAVRDYERFRRTFVVRISNDYFALQESKAAISNAFKSYLSRRQNWEKADFVHRMGRSRDIFDATRARSSLRSAEASLVAAKEQFASAADQFKIVIGMVVDQPLDVVPQGEDEDALAVESLLPAVDVAQAVAVAERFRLDVLTGADRVDDTTRAVRVAKNAVLPDLDATGSVTMDTDSDQKDSLSFNTERTTWRAAVELRMDDRKSERNAYRASVIALRRAQRDFEVVLDQVRADVRTALRRIERENDLRVIQAMNVEENEIRLEAARAQFNLGRASNQDVIDAEDDLLQARNELANAVARYRNAILAFRLDTGTLRVSDEGEWIRGQPLVPADSGG